MPDVLTIDSDKTYVWHEQSPEMERIAEDVERRVREYVKNMDRKENAK